MKIWYIWRLSIAHVSGMEFLAKMLRKTCFAFALFVILNSNLVGQKRIIRDDYLKVTPYVSTLEDVTKVYGEGHDTIRGREGYGANLIRYPIGFVGR